MCPPRLATCPERSTRPGADVLELVTFPDVEAWAVEYLAAHLSVPVSTRVPNPRPITFVAVRRDGGTAQSVVTETARLGIRCWAATDEDASDLSLLVRALLMASPGEGPVRSVNRGASSAPSYLTEESGQPLRFFTVELVIRASAT